MSCTSAVRATRDFTQAPSFPGWLSVPTPIFHLHSLGVTWPVEGTIRGFGLGCCLRSIGRGPYCLGSTIPDEASSL